MSHPPVHQHRSVLFVVTAIRIFRASNLSGLAQQIAYNILFAVAPLLIFVTAFCGLVIRHINADLTNPVEPIIQWLDDTLPAEAAAFLKEPVQTALTTSPEFLLSFGGILILWSAQNALSSIMRGLNVTYGMSEQRPFILRSVISVFLTIGLALTILLTGLLQFLGTELGQDVAVRFAHGRDVTELASWGHWPLTLGMAILILVLIHRFTPSRKAPLIRYLPGAAFSTLGLVAATWGLQFYFDITNGFSAAYGVFGALLAFLFWLYILGMVILLGGVLNATLFEMALGASASPGRAESPTSRPDAVEPD